MFCLVAQIAVGQVVNRCGDPFTQIAVVEVRSTAESNTGKVTMALQAAQADDINVCVNKRNCAAACDRAKVWRARPVFFASRRLGADAFRMSSQFVLQ